MKNFVLFGLLLLLFWTCKKDVINSSAEDPELYVKTTIDEIDFKVVGGINGYYNRAFYADADDSTDVGQFASLFYDIENETEEKIEIRIRNIRTGGVSPIDIDSLLLNNELPYYSLDVKSYYPVQFTSNISDSTLNPNWDFGDGTVSSLHDPLKLYEVGKGDKYHVTLSSNCMDTSISSDVFLLSSLCSASIEISQVDSSNGLGFIYRAIVNGKESFKYNWRLNNGITAKTAEIKYVYPQNTSDIEHIRLVAIDANNCIMNVEKKHNVGNSLSCYSNFQYNLLPITQLVDSSGLGQVEIVYTDKNNIEYSSFNGSQPISSYFSILGNEDYILNEEGDPTKILDISFQCLVQDQNGNRLQLLNGMGRIAIAHP